MKLLKRNLSRHHDGAREPVPFYPCGIDEGNDTQVASQIHKHAKQIN